MLLSSGNRALIGPKSFAKRATEVQVLSITILPFRKPKHPVKFPVVSAVLLPIFSIRASWLQKTKRPVRSEWFRSCRFLTSELNGAAILSVYNKQGLLDLAKGLIKNNVRLLASGGTASLIRNAGFDVE